MCKLDVARTAPAPRPAQLLFVPGFLAVALALFSPPVFAQCTLADLVADDAAELDFFGWSIATDSGVVVVGATGANGRGAAYAYRFNVEPPVEDLSGDPQRPGPVQNTLDLRQSVIVQKLTSDDVQPLAEFGLSVAVSRDIIFVGAPDDGIAETGAVYVFQFVGEDWVQVQRILASDSVPGDKFGYAVSVSRGVALIGAIHTDDKGEDSGSVYVFRYDGSAWQEETKLVADDGEAGAEFGRDLAIRGRLAVIGAPFHGDSGSAYIFRYDPDQGSWAQRQKLESSDPDGNDRFGLSVALCGYTAIVGAIGDSDFGPDSGAAYVFRSDGGPWTEETKLTAHDADDMDWFGTSVAIQGSVAVVGAPGAFFQKGATYIYRYDGNVWAEDAKFIPTSAFPGDRFASSIGLSGDLVVGGAPLKNNFIGFGSGAAYVLAVDPGCEGFGESNESCLVEEFLRGDSDGNGVVNGFADGLYLLIYEFAHGPKPPCEDAADIDDNGLMSGLVDGLFALNYLFLPGAFLPPAPGPFECGSDPTFDLLRCLDPQCP